MTIEGVSHIALWVTDLRAAESYYARLLGLEVAFREAPTDAGWATLPPGASWAEAERSGISLEMAALRREGLVLALESADAVSPDAELSHIGLHVDSNELDRWRRAAPALECQIVADRPDLFVVRDRFGVQWELATSAEVLSSGQRSGRWLDVDARVTPPIRPVEEP